MPDNYITVPGEQGTIFISEGVIAEIAGAAVSETEGVDCLTNAAGPDFSERLGFKSSTRGVSVDFDGSLVRIGAAIFARYGESIATIGERAQKAVAATIESITGLKSQVAIHVAGVTFDK